MTNGGRFSGASSAVLTISNLIASDAGTYTAVIGNSFGGAVSSNVTLTVNALDHFSWSVIPSTVSTLLPFDVRVEARDSFDQPINTFNGMVNIGAAIGGNGTPVPVSPSMSGTFVSGVWKGGLSITQIASNVVLRADDGAGISGLSAPFAVRQIVAFTQQPTNQNVLPGTNVTVSAAAVGTGPLHWQWRFEGTNIFNATNASYSFTNANLTNYHGNFSVVVSDDLSSITSSNAFVYVLLKPGIVTHVQPTSVLQGGTAFFSLVATGAPPLGYRWVRDGGNYTTSSVPFLFISNVQASVSFRVIVTNLANMAGVFSPGPTPSGNVALTMIPDFDGDGIADTWEILYGMNTNNAADALLDFDGDGMSNRDEYIAGTNPTNAASVLQIVFATTNATVLRFIAQSNVGYTVQYQTNLSSPNWMNLTNITAQPQMRTTEVNVLNPSTFTERFFRVLTPPAP
jgi:hypothetical protein